MIFAKFRRQQQQRRPGRAQHLRSSPLVITPAAQLQLLRAAAGHNNFHPIFVFGERDDDHGGGGGRDAG